jgi:IclR family transcriptional regulator, acetate operon repressor
LNSMVVLGAHGYETPGEQDRSSLGAVDKAMTLLSALIVDGRPMGLAELTRRTGLAKSTAHRLIGILRSHDMIDRHDEAYVPGERLAGIGRPAGDEFLKVLGRAARPYLVELYQATGATTSLGVLNGTEVRYVDRIYGHRSVRTPSHRSDRAPAHCTAIGKILLAYSQESSRLIRDHQPLAAMTPATITAPPTLWAELDVVRRQGIAYSRAEYVDGVVCVAVLVSRATASRPPVAIALSGRIGELDLAAARARLPRTAFSLSTAIRQATARAASGPSLLPAA